MLRLGGMKKIKTLVKRPLQLDTQTVRDLLTTELRHVVGGALATSTNPQCMNHNAKRLVVTP